MYPNPQDVLPLPSRPSLEQYRKQAKGLVKACKSDDPAAIRVWAAHWIDGQVDEVVEFARTKLSRNQQPPKCALADAQFVIARVHGFLSWPRFANHLTALARATSAVSAFEAAADAIVSTEPRG